MKNQYTYDDGGVFGTFTGDLRFGDLEGVERFEFFSTSSKNDQSALQSKSVGKNRKNKTFFFKNQKKYSKSWKKTKQKF